MSWQDLTLKRLVGCARNGGACVWIGTDRTNKTEFYRALESLGEEVVAEVTRRRILTTTGGILEFISYANAEQAIRGRRWNDFVVNGHVVPVFKRIEIREAMMSRLVPVKAGAR